MIHTPIRNGQIQVLLTAATLLAPALAPARPLPCPAPVEEFRMEILVDGLPRPVYRDRETSYIEALRGREYRIRLYNPLPVRVGVALAVDGLNTIDAKTTSAWKAAKWVLDPYQTMEIPGWQVSGEVARRFVFTGERGSLGAWLGQTENVGVIEAVFFAERRHWGPIDPMMQRSESAPLAAPTAGVGEETLDDAYAATGMGNRQEHRVRWVSLRFQRDPAATVRLRYEFRPALERLGVLTPRHTPLQRRERARGFSDFCPEPPGW